MTVHWPIRACRFVGFFLTLSFFFFLSFLDQKRIQNENHPSVFISKSDPWGIGIFRAVSPLLCLCIRFVSYACLFACLFVCLCSTTWIIHLSLGERLTNLVCGSLPKRRCGTGVKTIHAVRWVLMSNHYGRFWRISFAMMKNQEENQWIS